MPSNVTAKRTAFIEIQVTSVKVLGFTRLFRHPVRYRSKNSLHDGQMLQIFMSLDLNFERLKSSTIKHNATVTKKETSYLKQGKAEVELE